MMEFLSTVSLIASIIYLFVGFYVYRLNSKSETCRMFLFLTISLAVWSFAFSFAYTAETPYEYSFWNKFSAFGWCTFPSFVLYLIMLITNNRFLKYWYIKTLVILPAPFFLFLVLFRFGPEIETSQIIETIFYKGNFLYNFSYPLLSICLLIFWGWNSKISIQKKQSYIIAITSIIPFLITLVVQTIFPMLGILNIPNMGQIYALIMLWGVYQAIIKYQFMAMPNSLITKALFHELSGLTFLVDAKGIIMKANQQSYQLLKCEESEIINIPIDSILNDERIYEFIKNYESITEPLYFEEIYISTKLGNVIPFHISLIPLFHSKTQFLHGLLIIGQDLRTTKSLQSEIKNRKLTNEKLRNSEELFRTIIEIMPFSIIVTSKTDHSILYVNEKVTEFFNMDKSEFIGTDASIYYKNPEQRQLILNEMVYSKQIKERETTFISKNGTEFLGLMTMVPAVYLEQEVILTCISDITKQRRLQKEVATSEKKLKELMHSIPDIVIVTDLNGNINFVNNSAYTIYGNESENTLISQNILSLIAPEDIDRAKEYIIKILTNNPGPVEFKSILKDGTVLNVEANGMVLFDDKNAPTELIYVVRNITDRKLLNEKLSQNNIDIENMNIELIKMNNILKNRSVRDSLTNLYNHQHINDLLEKEISKASNKKHDLCVMMLDIDYFKKVNDTYGHQIGDQVLVVVSNLMIQNSRSIDMIGRYGGEEFFAILPEIQVKDAYQIAEHIRLSIRDYNFGLPHLQVTISVGLAQFETEDPKALVNKADELLYQAKRNGRNRIEYSK